MFHLLQLLPEHNFMLFLSVKENKIKIKSKKGEGQCPNKIKSQKNKTWSFTLANYSRVWNVPYLECG